MTIALSVMTKSIQHYHFHFGEDEESRGLSNNKNNHKVFSLDHTKMFRRGGRRLNGGKHNVMWLLNEVRKQNGHRRVYKGGKHKLVYWHLDKTHKRLP